jgi:hypothetical protein
MKSKTGLIVVAFFIIAAAVPPAPRAAGSLYGSAGLSAYVYGDTLEERQSDLYGNLLLKIRDDSGISFALNGRLAEPLTTDRERDWNLYSTHLGWTSKGRRLSVTAGRQLMFVGVIRGFQDGILVKLNRIHGPSDLSLTLFGGRQASAGLDPKLMGNGGDDRRLGLAAKVRLFGTLDAQLSSSFLLDDTQEQSDMIGLLCEWRAADPLRLDGSCEYDVTRKRWERMHARAAFSSSMISCSAEYLFRESLWIPESSWYSRFADLLDPCSQYRLALKYQPSFLDWLSGSVSWISSEEDEHSLGCYVAAGDRFRLGYRFSGDSDMGNGGVYGSVRQKLTDTFRIDAGVDFSKYTVYDLYDTPSYGSYVRLNCHPAGAFHFFSEVQYRQDRIMDTDVRAFIGAGYRFRHSYGSTGEQAGGHK